MASMAAWLGTIVAIVAIVAYQDQEGRLSVCQLISWLIKNSTIAASPACRAAANERLERVKPHGCGQDSVRLYMVCGLQGKEALVILCGGELSPIKYQFW